MLLVSTGLFSCAPKPASKGYFLGNSSIKGNRVISDSELDALIPQKPNRRLLGLPIFPWVGLYQFGELFYNREEKQRKVIEVTQNYQKESQEYANSPRKLEKIQRRYAKKLEKAQIRAEQGNFWMRVLGEAPVYYIRAEAEQNAEKMQKYLYNNGFFDAKVGFEPDTIFNRIRVYYNVTENRPTMIRDVQYQVYNRIADSIITADEKNVALVPKKRYDGDTFEEERVRIETLLRDQGYMGFSRQNVSYLVNDTIHNPATDSLFKSVDVKVRVDMPNEGNKSVRYGVNSVSFEVLPPYGTSDSLFRKDTTYFEGIKYVFADKRFSTKILDSKIQVRPGAIYSQKKERDTQQQLSLTDQFRFVNYSYTLDSTGKRINSSFRVIPLEKYQISTDVGLNVIQLQGTPGPFANLSYKIRNVFNGMENFETNVRAGIELVPNFVGNQQIYRSEEIGVNASLTFPRLLTPKDLFKRQTANYNPRTQLSVGYNYVNRPEYTRTNVKVNTTYSWQPTTKTLFNVSLVDMNILRTPYIRGDFQELLDDLFLQGNNLIYSFQKGAFVSDIAANFVYNTNSLIGPQKKAQYFRIALESGGTTLNILPRQQDLIRNIFNSPDLQFYKYLRWNADYRRYWPTGRRTAFVARINSGAIYSYGSNKVPPYEKYFFAGGSNSLRAWLPRRLGPGSAAPRLTKDSLSIESPGEFLLEGNLEWRGFLAKFFGDINYALFIDVGNVWNLGSTATEEQKFKPNKLLSEIAVGTGFGIRYDLSFFILRFDFGVKVYDPATQRFVLDELKFNKLFNRTQSNFLNINLGVGYPF
ncbi:translocation and assembly module lipoprotein TamL [Dyadobacter sp. MSC1_007]|jgi:outer membrane protein assembly factor BamA|uniref:translocation and assembly module lipoprotein TamL n=1 Tax=Dyadobacter sp. MSC1_007 TaxID=2909264 RepID=UPI00202E66AF|nr:BamA/TamA family outer membrane protein [Dyadobacter sp. MSC1_007]